MGGCDVVKDRCVIHGYSRRLDGRLPDMPDVTTRDDPLTDPDWAAERGFLRLQRGETSIRAAKARLGHVRAPRLDPDRVREFCDAPACYTEGTNAVRLAFPDDGPEELPARLCRPYLEEMQEDPAAVILQPGQELASEPEEPEDEPELDMKAILETIRRQDIAFRNAAANEPDSPILAATKGARRQARTAIGVAGFIDRSRAKAEERRELRVRRRYGSSTVAASDCSGT